MNLLSNLQYSLNAIFELYKTQWRRWYAFSMLFAIFSSLFSIIVITAFLFAYYESAHMLGVRNVSSFAHLAGSGEFFGELLSNAQLIMVLNMSLFALFIYRKRNDDDAITPAVFFRSIAPETWGLYVLFSIGGMLASKLFLQMAVAQDSYSNSLEYLIGSHYSPFEEWLLSLVRLAVGIFPVFLAFLLVRRDLAKSGTILDRNNARTAFFALLILAFAIDNFSTAALAAVQRYILSVLLIPFMESWIPYVLVFVVCIFLIAVFYPALAGAVLFPFLYRNEKTLVDGTIIDE